MQEYEIRAQTPTVELYRHLRVAAGLSPKSEEAARAGLPRTWSVSWHTAATGRSAWAG